MSVKREISTSLEDSKECKRIALTLELKSEPHNMNTRIKMNVNMDSQQSISTKVVPNNNTTSVLSVMSSASTDFDSQYEKIKEIGRGGFSTVFQCMHRQSGEMYAVKVRLPSLLIFH